MHGVKRGKRWKAVLTHRSDLTYRYLGVPVTCSSARAVLNARASLLRYSSNNLNQLTRRVHETGRIYEADLEDISQKQDAIWDGVHEILDRLSSIS